MPKGGEGNLGGTLAGAAQIGRAAAQGFMSKKPQKELPKDKRTASEVANNVEKAFASNPQQPAQVFSTVGRGLVGGGYGPLPQGGSGPVVPRTGPVSFIKPVNYGVRRDPYGGGFEQPGQTPGAMPNPHVWMHGTDNSYADMFTMHTPDTRPGMGSRIPFGPPSTPTNPVQFK